MRDTCCHIARSVLLLVAGICFAAAGDARAACNEPPDPAAATNAATARFHTGTSGNISSPFLIPGELVGHGNMGRTTTISVSDTSSHGPVDDDVLTVAIRDSSPQIAATFAEDCSGIATCNPAVPCHPIGSLSFGTGPRSLTFKNSDVLEKLTRTGPIRLAITPAADVPCALATTACPPISGSMHACIDDVELHPGSDNEIVSVTALPLANDFQKFCKGGGNSQCNKTGGTIRYTLDLRGDMLVPFEWGKLLKKGGGQCKEGDKCDTRNVIVGTNLYSGISTSPLINIPCDDSDTYLQSFAATGGTFSPGPLFEALDGGANPVETRLRGTIDEAFSVLRIRRCPWNDPTCANPRFTLSLGTKDFLEIKVPAGKTGTCSVSGVECSKSDPCPTGQKCTWFDAEDGGAGNPPPVVCPNAESEEAAGTWVLIIIVIAGVILLIWVFRKKS